MKPPRPVQESQVNTIKEREKSAGKWDPHGMISSRHLILAILLLLTVACGSENKKKVGLPQVDYT